MKPYKLKHVPTGLYYQPHKHKGSNLSKTGKIYQTKANILSRAFFGNGDKRDVLTVYCEPDSRIHKQTLNILNWSTPLKWSGQLACNTPSSDWIIEEI